MRERSICHGPVQQDLLEYSHSRRLPADARVLIPGAGLSRLAFNLACQGYKVEAIDVSYIQLLATNFILSRNSDRLGLGPSFYEGNLSTPGTVAAASLFQLYPFATQFSNHLRSDHQFVHAEIPDVGAADCLDCPILDQSSSTLTFTATGLTLSAKDFTRDFDTKDTIGTYDAIVTVFFIDTAKNFLEYARTAYSVLKPGGIWINVGPLLWNCYELGPGGRREGDVDTDEDNRTRLEAAGTMKVGLDTDFGDNWDPKIELSNEEVLDLLGEMGFAVRKEEVLQQEAGYIQDPESMLQSRYRLAHWVAEKVPRK
jgi:carnosine N-methyltransferase